MTRNIELEILDHEYDTLKVWADAEGQTVSATLTNAVRGLLEDWQDARDAEEILMRGEETYPWEQVRREAGL